MSAKQPPKKPVKTCKHTGHIYPTAGRYSLYHDAIVGWVVEVQCGKCKAAGVAPVDLKNIDWEET
jgi:hypothetical protein